ncbi:MAG: EscU/YscU/HrcU family type III secretion system export apparatus switch protein [Treponema sp.]|jgi:flagellar biosynthesis protein|nr:EscU/YscU/HrcU family type III secretion system export apparatus switch protein [Treponema sp.]
MRKRKLASAIRYLQGEPAPQLLASGRDREAEKIIEIARQSGIMVVEDTALANLLDTDIKIGDYIPVWCWEAAAKILAFVSQYEKKY